MMIKKNRQKYQKSHPLSEELRTGEENLEELQLTKMAMSEVPYQENDQSDIQDIWDPKQLEQRNSKDQKRLHKNIDSPCQSNNNPNSSQNNQSQIPESIGQIPCISQHSHSKDESIDLSMVIFQNFVRMNKMRQKLGCIKEAPYEKMPVSKRTRKQQKIVRKKEQQKMDQIQAYQKTKKELKLESNSPTVSIDSCRNPGQNVINRSFSPQQKHEKNTPPTEIISAFSEKCQESPLRSQSICKTEKDCTLEPNISEQQFSPQITRMRKLSTKKNEEAQYLVYYNDDSMKIRSLHQLAKESPQILIKHLQISPKKTSPE